MKRKLKFALPILCALALTGCQTNQSKSEATEGSSASSEVTIDPRFEEYRHVQSAFNKGLELYAWKNGSEWFSGLLGGTNRYKTVEEIVDIQQNPCPIEIMRQILYADYEQDVLDMCYIFIVSNPPLESELIHSGIMDQEDLMYLIVFFGLEKNYSYMF